MRPLLSDSATSHTVCSAALFISSLLRAQNPTLGCHLLELPGQFGHANVVHLTVIRVREASQFFLTAHFPLLRNHSHFTRRIGRAPNKRANRKLRK